MSIRAVIFDLDGTLLDTLDDLTDAIDYALNKLDRASLSRECVRRFVGNGVPKLIERALAFTAGDGGAAQESKRFDECLKLFTEYYDVHNADKTKPYDGAVEMLRAVKSRGIRTAIVTNKYDGAAQALKKRFFDSVDAVVGAMDGVRPKPAPDGVNKALGILGEPASRAIYVGDGETDIATARNCDMPVVAVTWGFRARDVLEGLRPDYIIDSPDELIKALDMGTIGGGYDAR